LLLAADPGAAVRHPSRMANGISFRGVPTAPISCNSPAGSRHFGGLPRWHGAWIRRTISRSALAGITQRVPRAAVAHACAVSSCETIFCSR